MPFLNKSVKDYKCKNPKQNVLIPLLKSLEKSDEFSIGKDINTEISYDYIISNNNKKYYLLITKKQLEQQKYNQKYDMLHFFPDQSSKDDNLLENDTSSGFYLEIDSFFDDEFLLEGYLYKSDDKYEYLLTDILVKNNDIVNVSFELRYSLLNEIIQKIGKVYLNKCFGVNHMTIKMHPVFETFSSDNNNTTTSTTTDIISSYLTSGIKKSDIKKSDIKKSDMTVSSDYDSDMTISSLLQSTNFYEKIEKKIRL
jgi:hypothetical protein